ncbi:MAG: hypothetical protein RBS68_03285 [Anaerolineales bacterium]|nr:hypothetical protein [Anaerolineales bacterium]
MLSLIVDEALKGVDIEIQYPDFYGRLLKNAALRQAFLDTLELIEAEKEGLWLPLPAGEAPSLAFLHKKPNQAEAQQVGMEHWQIRLQRTIQELRNIFSPPKLAYRADANLYDDNWFTVLRDEIELGGFSYAILLECGISKETEDALSASLNLALTLEAATSSGSPVYASLHWGKYNETITIAEEGYTRFPDIPFSATFDQQSQEISADLDLVLEIKPA